MPKLKKETYLQQSLLAQYCRNGETPQGLMDVNKKNVYHYRRLVLNIITDILETAYPLTYKYLDQDVWEEVILNFFIDHKCQTPQVWRVPLEFYQYCTETEIQKKLNIPFLIDLLHFEWLEMEVHTMEDIEYPIHKLDGDWMNEKIALNPEHKLITLTYPVHTTAPFKELADKKGTYFLLMYREQKTGNVQMVDLSVLYTYVLESIKNGILLNTILNEADSLFQINDRKLLEEKTLHFVEDLRNRKFIIGITE